ncbi:MAG: hypothetical protein EAZ06_10255 [Cytophagales bacterium]|nr:MAG: hypothetical protein EAZ06_10255 [Cytophagales bacterium]
MKKIIYIFFYNFIFINILLSCNLNENESNSLQKKEKIAPKNIPLLVVTGFGSELENISLSELKQKYCEGKIYVLQSIKKEIDTLWQCSNLKTIQKLQDFVPFAKNNLLLTNIDNTIAQFKALKIDEISFFDDSEKYPLTNPYTKSPPFEYKKNVTHFVLTGVTAITRNQGLIADTAKPNFLIENLLPHVKNADLLHISNEVSIDDNCVYKSYDPLYKFCVKEKHLRDILTLGADIVELTGNHNLDYGVNAYKKTAEWYKKNNLKTFGGGVSPEEANKPLVIILKDSTKLGFIGFNESCPNGECADVSVGANRYQKEKARKVIATMRKELKVDFIIVGTQFDEVDAYTPSASQTKIAYDLLDFGADMVYGSQAHQIQQIEFKTGKPIFHGLGNFLFDQVHRIGVRQAYFLHHYFYKGKLIQSIPVYTFIAMNRQPTIANKEQTEQMKKLVLIDKLLYKW